MYRGWPNRRAVPHSRPTPVRSMGGHLVGEFVQVGGLLGKRRAGGSDIVVVEAEVRDAELLEELEGGCHLGAGRFHRLEVGGEPRAVERAVAEDVVAGPVERVPVAHRHAQVLGHRLFADHAISVVPTERERLSDSGPSGWARAPWEKSVMDPPGSRSVMFPQPGRPRRRVRPRPVRQRWNGRG